MKRSGLERTPRLARRTPRPPHLPAPVAPIVGRARELREIQRCLLRKGVRLLTLTGAPGSGKTRLAVEAAARLQRRFQRGVGFVDLSPVVDPAFVTLSVVRALGIPDTLDPPTQAVIRAVTGSDLLLVLDNFEQVLAPALRSRSCSRSVHG